MALDDKVFQSAIAKINKIKAKQAIIPQIQVFEDPPHLRKPVSNSVDNVETSSEEIPIITEINTVIQNNVPINIPSPDSIHIKDGNSLSDRAIDNNENDVIVSKNNKYDIDSNTKYDTKKGTEDGTKQIINQNVVQKDDTYNNTITDTIKSTETTYIFGANKDSLLPHFPDFIYKRPYDSLTGIPKKIVDVIFEICRKYGVRETPPLPFSMLVRLCNEKKNSVKVTRQRLLDEGIIVTKNPPNAHARGRSGMLIYKLREDLFDEINGSLSLFVRGSDSLHNRSTKYSTERSTKDTSSSSYNKTTTTSLPDEWNKINFLALKQINFGIAELKNIFKKCPKHITPEIVQDSINQFAFGLANNPDRYKSMHAPAGVLVSKLCQGISWVENGYISQEELARIEKENRGTKLLEHQFREPKFLEWFSKLKDDEKENLVPNVIKGGTSYMISKTVIQREHAYRHFEIEIWPVILAELKTFFNINNK